MKEIIEIKQLPVIVEQLQTIKADITERTKSALSLVVTDETLAAVKKERAALTKEFSAWEEKRKEVKKAIISPYEQFEAVYKDCITDVFKTADAELKYKITAVESELKAQKMCEVKAYYDEYAESKGIDFVPFDCAEINITMSASMKSLKAKAKEFIDGICDDLELIETQEYKDEILYEYKQHFNVSLAVKTVTERYKALEKARQETESKKAEQEATQNAVEKVAKAIDEPIAAPTEEEKVYTLKFTVRGTMAKLKSLKSFLKEGNFDYE